MIPPEEGPLAGMEGWRDDVLERNARALVATSGRGYPTDRLPQFADRLDGETVAIAAVREELAEREADWRAASRKGFSAGLAEMRAERAAVDAYATTIKAALRLVRRLITEANSAARAEAKAQRAAGHPNRTGDSQLNIHRRRIIGAAMALTDAAGDGWSPDGELGLELRGAVAAYRRRAAEIDEGK